LRLGLVVVRVAVAVLGAIVHILLRDPDLVKLDTGYRPGKYLGSPGLRGVDGIGGGSGGMSSAAGGHIVPNALVPWLGLPGMGVPIASAPGIPGPLRCRHVKRPLYTLACTLARLRPKWMFIASRVNSLERLRLGGSSISGNRSCHPSQIGRYPAILEDRGPVPLTNTTWMVSPNMWRLVRALTLKTGSSRRAANCFSRSVSLNGRNTRTSKGRNSHVNWLGLRTDMTCSLAACSIVLRDACGKAPYKKRTIVASSCALRASLLIIVNMVFM